MLFNSHEFIFAFLPLTLLGFFLLGARSRNLALFWLVLASLLFYAWWRPINVLIIAPSIAINYALARALQSLVAPGDARLGTARAVLALGIVFNVCFLGYFKYINFLETIAHDLTGADFVLNEVVLPLGISFITFQKIAFLIDVHGPVEAFTLGDYAVRSVLPAAHRGSHRPLPGNDAAVRAGVVPVRRRNFAAGLTPSSSGCSRRPC